MAFLWMHTMSVLLISVERATNCRDSLTLSSASFWIRTFSALSRSISSWNLVCWALKLRTTCRGQQPLCELP